VTSNGIVQKLWNYCNVLHDDGMSYGDYVEQLTYLLFLKMADERAFLRKKVPTGTNLESKVLLGCTRAPYNQKSPVPSMYSWPSLIKKDGDELFDNYRHTLGALDFRIRLC
jgi:type I restriction enzyme M protein